jgi:hypothetical protein
MEKVRNVLDSRFIDGISKAKKTQRDGTANDEPNGPYRSLCFGIDL